jgi:hypothetical protein
MFETLLLQQHTDLPLVCRQGSRGLLDAVRYLGLGDAITEGLSEWVATCCILLTRVAYLLYTVRMRLSTCYLQANLTCTQNRILHKYMYIYIVPNGRIE